MPKPKILVSVLTDAETQGAAFCRDFLEFLFERQELTPEFVGNDEPVNNAVGTLDAALPYCSEWPFLWVRRHRVVSQGSLFHKHANAAGSVTLDAVFDPSYDWLPFFRGLIDVTEAYYGYVHLLTDEEWRLTQLEPEAISDFRLGAIAKTLEQGILELGWANYFGARWREQINAVRLANTCSRMEHLEGGYLFAITEGVMDVSTNYEDFDERRRAAKSAFTDSLFRRVVLPQGS